MTVYEYLAHLTRNKSWSRRATVVCEAYQLPPVWSVSHWLSDQWSSKVSEIPKSNHRCLRRIQYHNARSLYSVSHYFEVFSTCPHTFVRQLMWSLALRIVRGSRLSKASRILQQSYHSRSTRLMQLSACVVDRKQVMATL